MERVYSAKIGGICISGSIRVAEVIHGNGPEIVAATPSDVGRILDTITLRIQLSHKAVEGTPDVILDGI